MTNNPAHCFLSFSRVRKYFVLASSLLHLSIDISLYIPFHPIVGNKGKWHLIITIIDKKVFELLSKNNFLYHCDINCCSIPSFTFFMKFLYSFCKRIPLKCGQKLKEWYQRTNFGICYSLFTSSTIHTIMILTITLSNVHTRGSSKNIVYTTQRINENVRTI